MGLSITSMKTAIGELQRNYLFKVAVESYPLNFLARYPNADKMKDKVDLYLTKGIWPNRKTSQIQLKWAGETYYHSGVDESNKTGELTFRLDQRMEVKDFWEAAKDLTGDLGSHAALEKSQQAFTLGIYMIDVNKKVVTDYRRLIDVLVYSVDAIELGKENDNVVTFNVSISWDRQEKDDSIRGSEI